MSVRILIGDVRTKLAELAGESVHCVVTSPPYFGLRDYGMAGQIGLEETPAAFVEALVGVFRDVRRVLRADGTLFLNLGDSYFGGGGGGGSQGSKQQTNGGSLIPGHTRAGARRVAVYDKADKAPGDYPARDCLCGSLCDACRAAYRLGKSHSDGRRAPMPAASIASSSLERRGSPSDHPPMSGLAGQEGRSAAAIPDPAQMLGRADEPLPASPASTTNECARPHQDSRSPVSSQGAECLSCGRSLLDCALPSADMAACMCDTAGGASAGRKIGKDASDSAPGDYTTAFRLKPKDMIGIPWRVAFALQADGWYLRQDIIWSMRDTGGRPRYAIALANTAGTAPIESLTWARDYCFVSVAGSLAISSIAAIASLRAAREP